MKLTNLISLPCYEFLYYVLGRGEVDELSVSYVYEWYFLRVVVVMSMRFAV
jgi:hypothetical protein